MGCTFSTKCPDPIKPSCDGLRETPLRLLGYATHMGDACCAILPYSMIHVPNMITTAYMTTDIFNKGYKSAAAGESRKRIFVNTLDALIWQSLATILIPGLIVSRVKNYAIQATRYQPNSCSPPPPLVKALPPAIVKAFPCILGVLTLPLIMYPIDKAVTLLMDFTFRPIFKEADPEELKKKACAKSKEKEKSQKPQKPQKGAA